MFILVGTCWVIQSQDVGGFDPISTLVEPNFGCFKRHVLTTLAGQKWTAPLEVPAGGPFYTPQAAERVFFPMFSYMFGG